jgi:hypothetical protein
MTLDREHLELVVPGDEPTSPRAAGCILLAAFAGIGLLVLAVWRW